MRLALGMNNSGVVKPFVCLVPVRVVDLNMMNGDFSMCPDVFVRNGLVECQSPNILSSSAIWVASRRP
jgi:hypothetical protein